MCQEYKIFSLISDQIANNAKEIRETMTELPNFLSDFNF